ncbi:small heat shock protein, chloroplastic-like [Gastrolobium bilobum]|uniref:small heat shock protein, chloroplastic-like n=1 Tax=Gastrolobium bilobum TaxID=150636 RepID=UPI002AB02C07|nr:small heat shock protein, chloroplastic-like [Gastrolobium bilobum]
MAHALSSNLGLNLSILSKGSSKYLCPLGPTTFPQVSKLKLIRAMVGDDARGNLEHVPRHNKHQSHPKKRVAPASPIGLWDRFPSARTVEEMIDTMEGMMEDPFALSTFEWPSSPLPSEGVGGYKRRGRTPWEIKEGESEYKMRFDMPGMSKEDVKVWVEEKMLVVKAEKAPKKKNTEEEMVEQENKDEEEWSVKSYGRYRSRIALPENVQFEKIKAEVKDGVLYITIPKATSYSNILDIHVQ